MYFMYLADNGLPDAPMPVKAPDADEPLAEPFDELPLDVLPLPDPIDPLAAKLPEPW